jgi:hypothetical protein
LHSSKNEEFFPFPFKDPFFQTLQADVGIACLLIQNWTLQWLWAIIRWSSSMNGHCSGWSWTIVWEADSYWQLFGAKSQNWRFYWYIQVKRGYSCIGIPVQVQGSVCGCMSTCRYSQYIGKCVGRWHVLHKNVYQRYRVGVFRYRVLALLSTGWIVTVEYTCIFANRDVSPLNYLPSHPTPSGTSTAAGDFHGAADLAIKTLEMV